MSKLLDKASQLIAAHQFAEASELCRKAMKRPGELVRARQLLSDCHNNIGFALFAGGNLPALAESEFRQALTLNPHNATALRNLAGLLVAGERDEEAARHFEALAALAPGQAQNLRDLALCYQRLDRTEEASAVLRKLFALSPEDGSALLADALLIKSIQPDEAYARSIRQRILAGLDELNERGLAIADPFTLPGSYFYLSYHGLCNKELHQRIARARLKATPRLNWSAPHVAAWQGCQGRRIRLGIASRFLYNHSIGHTSRGLVEKIDRSRFEIFVIRLGEGPEDAIRKAIDGAAEHVVEVSVSALEPAQEAIAALQLDILFWQDLGMEPASNLLAHARLAPVQLTSFGHPDTTGIPNLDYFLSAQHYETAEGPAQYSEQLVVLPDVGTLSWYHPPEKPAAKTREAFGLASDEHLYLCPQTLFKIHPEMDLIFSEILKADPAGRIVLIAPAQTTLRKGLEQRWAQLAPGLRARISFVPRMSHEAFLQLMAVADVMLDTVHFNGQNTSLEGFTMGTPIVTMRGQMQRESHTGGMYRAMGYEALVCDTPAAYVATAVRLACDPAFREAAVDKISRLSGILFRNDQFIRECEKAMLAMIAARTRILTPAPQAGS